MASTNRQTKRFNPFWTIWLPLGLGVVLALSLFGCILFSTTAGNSQLSLWSQIGTVLLAFLIIFCGLFLLAALLISIIDIQKLANRIPGWLAKTSSFSLLNLARIRRVSDMAGKIGIFMQTTSERIRTGFTFLGHKINSKDI